MPQPPLSPVAVEVGPDEIRARGGSRNFVLIDVLPAESYREAHLPGAVSWPLAVLPSLARRALPDRGADLVVYCGGPT